ncbi:MAG: hypothetical protein U0599_29950, partial [Vicinamibacteria bacterium]
SRSLRWSWGSMIGRTNGWACRVGAQPAPAMVRALATAGFDGLWLDRWGYTGIHRPSFVEVERDLDALVGGKTVSAARRYAFYDLRPQRERLRREIGDAALERERRSLLENPPPVPGRWTCVADRGPERPGTTP